MKQILIIGIDAKDFLAEIALLLDKKAGIQSESTKGNELPNYLTRSEVAALLKITLPTLHDWTKLGWLKAYKMGHRVLYKSEEVHEALNKVSINKHKKYII
jgi:excisionase family DNA binding protein